MTNAPLLPSQLRQTCDPRQFEFKTTAELDDVGEMIGQARAMQALRFGAGVRHDGYNFFVLGPSGMGQQAQVRQFLEQQAAREAAPDDWCYLHNFGATHKPRALRLPCGRADQLRQQMTHALDYLRTAIPARFDSDEYRARAKALQDASAQREEQLLKQLGDEAEQQDVMLLRTPEGFAFAPGRDHKVASPAEFEQRPVEEKKQIAAASARFQEKLKDILGHLPQWSKELNEQIRALDRETTLSVVGHVLDEVRGAFADLPDVLRYLDAVQQDMAEHGEEFRGQDDSSPLSSMIKSSQAAFHRYQVNVLVSGRPGAGAPIVSEDNPTVGNLVGRVEHLAQMGALLTDFTLIKPGALHRANGGYLLLDAGKLLAQPFGWDCLKRALQAGAIHIESPGQMLSMVSTVSLEPEPIALTLKVVLFGERALYYLLQQYDPQFCELFKVAVDLEEQVERDGAADLLYARLIATLARKQALLPFERSAVAAVIEHGARLAGDAQRLSTHTGSVADLLCEADFHARQAGKAQVDGGDVRGAIAARIARLDRVKGDIHDAILRGTLMIDTHGAAIGQINALAVIALGQFAFAMPARITANTWLGDGNLVNIDREVRLSGASHSKGMLILSSFLAARYARTRPLALAASLVFEQSYAMVDGDSASLAELCALLSSLAGVPISQSLALTGSVNQFGQVQAIGAVNEKIEGFFDICSARGLDGSHGVLIPAANVKHLMLREDVVAAAGAGRFRIYAVETVDQAIAILTGQAAGEALADGSYPRASVNGAVAARLHELSAARQLHAHPPAPGGAHHVHVAHGARLPRS